MALEDGGVTFVKLGQMLSTRADLLPAEVIEELSRLQEQVAPVPWPEIEAVLEGELGPLDATFASLDHEPLAAASTAQVHAGRLRSGEDVVVKVQRPGIELAVERDLDVVLRLATTMERRRRRGLSVQTTIDGVSRSGLNASELARGLASAIREELDFRVEHRADERSPAHGRRRTPSHLDGHAPAAARLQLPAPQPRTRPSRALRGLPPGTAAMSPSPGVITGS